MKLRRTRIDEWAGIRAGYRSRRCGHRSPHGGCRYWRAIGRPELPVQFFAQLIDLGLLCGELCFELRDFVCGSRGTGCI